MAKKSRPPRPSSRTFTVHDLPARERPRERLMREGVRALNREEVLAVIISRGTRGRSVLDIVRELICRYKTLAAIADAPVEELTLVPGIGLAKACQLKAALDLARRLDEPSDEDAGSALSGPESVARLLRSRVADLKKECFYVLAVDARNRLIARDDVSAGSLNSTMAHPREVFERAIRAHADCYQTNGPQVGPVARYHLAKYNQEMSPVETESYRLFAEIRDQYPRAVIQTQADGSVRLLS